MKAIEKCQWLLVIISLRINDQVVKKETPGKTSVISADKLAEIVKKCPGRALEKGAKFGSAAVFRNSTAASFTIPIVIKIYHTGKGLCL